MEIFNNQLQGAVGLQLRVASIQILTDLARTQNSIFEGDDAKKAFKEQIMAFIIAVTKIEPEKSLIFNELDVFEWFCQFLSNFLVSF